MPESITVIEMHKETKRVLINVSKIAYVLMRVPPNTGARLCFDGDYLDVDETYAQVLMLLTGKTVSK